MFPLLAPPWRCIRRFAWLSAILFAPGLGAVRVSAADVDVQWRVRDVWRQPEGLPQETVICLLQSSDGYMWVGTKGGLVRFDGVRFTVFDDRDPAQIPENEVWALAEDRTGGLWIGMFGGGVSVLRDGQFERHTKASGLLDDFVTAFAVGLDGSVWVGVDHGLSVWKDGAFTNYSAASGHEFLDGVRMLQCDPEGRIWIGTNRGLVARYEQGAFTIVPTPDIRPERGIGLNGLLCASDGRVWLGTGQGLICIGDSGAVLAKYTTDDGLNAPLVRGLLQDRADNLWIGTANGLNRLRPDGRLESVDLGATAPGTRLVVTICEDHEGSVWIAMNGLLRLAPGLFTSYGPAQGLASDWAGTVLPAAFGGMWAGSNAGLNLVVDGRIQVAGATQGVPRTAISALVSDRRNRLWFGTAGGLYRSREPIASPADFRVAQFELVNRENIRALHEDRTGAIWVNTNTDGILRLAEDGAVTRFTTANGLPNNVPRGIVEDAKGGLWFGTRGGLAHFHDGRWRTFTTAEGLADNTVESLYLDRRGDLWIATRRGVTRMRAETFASFTAAHGLFASFVYGFVEDDLGHLWMPCARGVFRVALAHLDEFAAGRRRSIESDVFGVEHGLAGSIGNVGYHPVAARDEAGRLWFPMVGGLSVIDPARVGKNLHPPPVHIEQVVIDGRAYEPRRSGEIAAPPGRGDLEFRFAGLSFRAPEKVRFKYRLDGYDSAWVDAAGRREAFYSNIPPAQYTFRVIASNNDGVWNEAGATFAFELRPHFYETTWFLLSCAGLVAAAGVGLHRLRTRRLHAHSETLARLVAQRTDANVRMEAEILERQNAERALRTSEERYRRFFEEDLAGAFIAVPDGRIVACNPAFVRMFGFGSREEAVGFDLLPLYQNPGDSEKLMTQLVAEDKVQDYALEMRRRDGTPLHLIATVILDRDERGNAVEIKGYVIDTTERTRLEAQLRQSQKMEAIGRLAGGIAHDFNNLLTAIIGYAQLLLADRSLPAPVSEGLQEICDAGKRAATLTRQLLAFSRRQILQPRVLDLNALIAGLENMMRRLIGEDIQLEFSLIPEPAKIRADHGQIEQIIINLVLNSRDAMPDGGRLTIATSLVQVDDSAESAPADASPGLYVQLTVSDTGCGMSEEVQSHVFEPFFTTKPAGKGTGLGLSTVYGIVRQSQGHITLTSAPGQGAKFAIFLPHVPEPIAEPAVQAPLPSGPKSATILVVEDNDLVRSTTTRILRREGYVVVEAANAADAIAHFSRPDFHADVVLTDVVMPDRNGRDLAEQLVQMRPGLRVLFMSGYTDDEVLRYGVQTGRRFVEKPFTADVLLRKIHETLHD